MSLKNLSVRKRIPKHLLNKLDNTRINRIYKKFERHFNLKNDFLVAVSGGPDSIALAFLARIYAYKNSLNSHFFIVDHGLRKESSAEAKEVQKVLRKNFINLKILVWRGKKPSKNIQALARKKRYELLFKKCKKLKVDNVILGHHKNDLIENFIIRVSRGSGLQGLTSLNTKTIINEVKLIRPLLYTNKKDLIFIASYVFDYFIIDPSNYNENFRRIKIRRVLEELKNEGLNVDKILLTIQNLKYTSDSIDFYVKKNMKKNTSLSKDKSKFLLSKNFFQQSSEVNFRSLSLALKIVGKKYYSTRGKKIEKIIAKIKNGSHFKETLGGCLVETFNNTIILSKEKNI
tara:strand:- start:13508 stop:14542 length:1035 start_codon:yes stop_codon:yes gene_type:complete